MMERLDYENSKSVYIWYTMKNNKFLETAMLEIINFSDLGEECIRKYYKFPLGFLLLKKFRAASNIYDFVINQESKEDKREFNTYYDCWLYLYAKLANNSNAKIHYEKIKQNITVSGGFSALPNSYPELRATAISGICAFFEKDKQTLIGTVDYMSQLQKLNESQDNFYFMTDNQNNLIKNFSIENERRYVFKTQKTRPLLYSFSLAVIALLCAENVTKNQKYIDVAEKYAQPIMENDIKNDYCGKSAIAMSTLHNISGQKKYLQMANRLSDYICEITIKTIGYVQNKHILPIDRLAEYALGLEFCRKTHKQLLPDIITSHLKKYNLTIANSKTDIASYQDNSLNKKEQ